MSSVVLVKVILPAVRVQDVVSEELPDVSMEGVRARLDGGIHDAAFEIAELGGGIIGDQVELLDCIRSWSVTEFIV